jgi:hypothetical protein
MKYEILKHVDPEVWEPPYLEKTLEYLSDLGDEYNFIIGRANSNEDKQDIMSCIDSNKDKKNVLILLSDELGIQNDVTGPYFWKENIHCIFRTYNNSDLYDNKWVFPIPCGFSCGVGHHSSDGNTHTMRDFDISPKPLKERKYDFFFSGQMDPHRMSCVEQLRKIENDFECIINVTNSFGKGFNINQYYELLGDSKIAIVPTGVVIPESFRYFEAVKSKCVIISTFPIDNEKFKNWYYEDSNTIFVKDWSSVTKEFIEGILSKIEEYEEGNIKYFEEKISPRGLSRYIKEKLKEV